MQVRVLLAEISNNISNGLKQYFDKIGRNHPIKKPLPFKSQNASGKRMWVFNADNEHQIYVCDLWWYLDNGWKKGRYPNNKKPVLTEEGKYASSGKGKKIVHNKKLKQNKRINPDEV